jgi:hypothetical protein
MRDPDLRGVLREEAERHTPDPSSMLDRIEERRRSARRRGMALRLPIGPRARRTVAVLRPVAAAMAVAGVLVAGATGIHLANRPPTPEDRVAATKSPTPAPTSPTAVPTRRATGRPPIATSRPHTPTHAASSLGPATSITSAPGFLTATAVLDRYSIPTWSQNDLTLTTTETVTALDVTVKVEVTAGVTDSGRWSTLPGQQITTTVTATPAELTYHFTLDKGATLAPGAYTFAVQYLHAGPRDVTADAYTVSATAAAPASASASDPAPAPAELAGHFTG